jgi:hypothetical protein
MAAMTQEGSFLVRVIDELLEVTTKVIEDKEELARIKAATRPSQPITRELDQLIELTARAVTKE